MPDLELVGVEKHFGVTPRVDALRGISISIAQGSYVAIEGESGGGKSTLLNIVGLLDTPSAGSYLIDGVDVAKLSEKEACVHRSRTFAFIFQSFHLVDRRSVVENVALPLHYRGVDARESRARALAALEKVDLAEFAWSFPATLSGGQRQRVAIARALASEAPVVVADEPTGNLDSKNSEAVLESFDRLQESGATLIVVTHSDATAAHARRRVRVSDGKIVDDETYTAADGSIASRRLEGMESARPKERPATVRARAMLADAWQNVMSRTWRTVGLVVAIGVSLALATATLGLVGSAGHQVSDQFDTATRHDVSAVISGDDAHATLDTGLEAIQSAVAGLNGVTRAAVLEEHGGVSARVGEPRAATTTTVFSAVGPVAQALRLSVEWGPEKMGTLGHDQALVGKYLAKNLGLAAVDVRPTIEVDGNVVTVVGIIGSAPRDPSLMGKMIRGAGDSETEPTGNVTVYAVAQDGAAHSVATEIPLAIDPARPSRVDVSAPVQFDHVRARVEQRVSAGLGILTIVTLTAALILVILATVASVNERRSEIGLRRAVGARKHHVGLMLTVESIVYGLLGGAFGVIAGMAAVLTITVVRHWTPVFDPLLAPIALAAGVVIACVGAVVGAVRAIGIAPSEALRA